VLKFGRTLANFAAILGGWFVFCVVMTLVPGVTDSVRVFLPPQALAENLPEDVAIMKWDEKSAVLYSDRPGFVADLYKAGALLVLPARKSGCIDLSEPSPDLAFGAQPTIT
jgi:hypothetical protein